MVLCAASLLVAYQLRFDGEVPEVQLRTMMVWSVALPVLRLWSLFIWGAYQSVWRYLNMKDAVLFSFAAVPPTLLALVLRLTYPWHQGLTSPPSSVVIIELAIFCISALSMRMLRRAMFRASAPSGDVVRRVILIGTCPNLAAALHDINLSPDVEVVGLLTEDPDMRGLSIGGHAVLGAPDFLDQILVSFSVDVVLIAAANLQCVGECVRTAGQYGAEVRLLPSAGEVLEGTVRVSAIPHAELALWNQPKEVAPPHELVVQTFRDKVVLVTGAGGSIGSELCRQLAALPISSLILLDQDENAIFEVRGQIRSFKDACPTLVSLVADIRDGRHLEQIFQTYVPTIVLHAAAYKHVGMMEENSSEAVLNNVDGTRTVLEAASSAGTERFVMISTDKAVKPTSIMGATKRLAELLVQAHAASANLTTVRPFHCDAMRCACVRFGNVLGSRGSVVPIFLRQIASGGPVTITHEAMTRYFMTIPEAVRLVLQASTVGATGEVFMLNMGDPVKITSLARRLIEMSGLIPYKDIEIQYTQPCSGEKIHEQLWYEDSAVEQTLFPNILTVKAGSVPSDLKDHLRMLGDAALTHNDGLVLELLHTMPIGFRTMVLPNHEAKLSA